MICVASQYDFTAIQPSCPSLPNQYRTVAPNYMWGLAVSLGLPPGYFMMQFRTQLVSLATSVFPRSIRCI